MKTTSTDIRGLQLTLAVYLVIFVLKLIVYVVSGVMALLGEALHTLSDIFVAGFSLGGNAGMHIVVARGQPVEEAEQIAEQVRVRVHQGADTGFCVIHVDAAELEQIPAAGQKLLPRSYPPHDTDAQQSAPVTS